MTVIPWFVRLYEEISLSIRIQSLYDQTVFLVSNLLSGKDSEIIVIVQGQKLL